MSIKRKNKQSIVHLFFPFFFLKHEKNRDNYILCFWRDGAVSFVNCNLTTILFHFFSIQLGLITTSKEQTNNKLFIRGVLLSCWPSTSSISFHNSLQKRILIHSNKLLPLLHEKLSLVKSLINMGKHFLRSWIKDLFLAPMVCTESYNIL